MATVQGADEPRPRRLPGGPVSTVADAERGLTLGYVLMRSGTLVLVAVGVVRGASAADHRTPYLLLALAAAVITVACCAGVWRRGALGVGWGGLDLVSSVVVLAVQPLVLPADVLVGDWAAWGGGFATAAAVATGAWPRSIRGSALASTVLLVAYLGAMLPVHAAPLTVLLANGLVYPVMGVTAGVFCTYLRTVARQAQQSQDEAVETARQVELDRYRLLVHDATGILRLLGADDTPRAMLPALRRQATTEATRLRRYLSDTRPERTAGAEDWTLGRVVDDAVVGFGDLPLEISTDLGAHVRLSEGDALALQRALATVLHNTRRHAAAGQVVIHADATADTWALVVRDDGVGFDPATTTLGYGLGVQVLGELRRRDLDVRLHSQPAVGTSVTITGAHNGG